MKIKANKSKNEMYIMNSTWSVIALVYYNFRNKNVQLYSVYLI